MSSRLIPLLLSSAALVYACGPKSSPSERGDTRAARENPGEIVSSVGVRVTDGIQLAFHVTNSATKRLELQFPSGQTHEFAVLDTLGREVWRWSDGRMFTQAMQSRVLERDETVTYSAQWKPSNLSGDYIAVASLRSENHPIEQRVRFTLP